MIVEPQAALFFLAFLPQFVDPALGQPSLQILVLGLAFILLGLATDSLWALAAGTAGETLRQSRRWAQTQRYVSGSASAHAVSSRSVRRGGRRIADASRMRFAS